MKNQKTKLSEKFKSTINWGVLTKKKETTAKLRQKFRVFIQDIDSGQNQKETEN